MEKKITNKPGFDVVSFERYTDKKKQIEKMHFTKVGVAWELQEKKGYFLKLRLQNPTGDYYVFPRKEKKED